MKLRTHLCMFEVHRPTRRLCHHLRDRLSSGAFPALLPGGAFPLLVILLIFAALTVPACATGFTGTEAEDFGEFRIDVINELAPRVSIYLVSEAADAADAAGAAGAAGEEGQLLGAAPVEGTTTFRIEVEDPTGPHRLRAALPRNQEMRSESFVPSEVGGVRWDLAANELTSGAEGADEAAAGSAGSAGSAGRDRTGGSGQPTDGLRRPSGSRRFPVRP